MESSLVVCKNCMKQKLYVWSHEVYHVPCFARASLWRRNIGGAFLFLRSLTNAQSHKLSDSGLFARQYKTIGSIRGLDWLIISMEGWELSVEVWLVITFAPDYILFIFWILNKSWLFCKLLIFSKWFDVCFDVWIEGGDFGRIWKVDKSFKWLARCQQWPNRSTPLPKCWEFFLIR